MCKGGPDAQGTKSVGVIEQPHQMRKWCKTKHDNREGFKEMVHVVVDIVRTACIHALKAENIKKKEGYTCIPVPGI